MCKQGRQINHCLEKCMFHLTEQYNCGLRLDILTRLHNLLLARCISEKHIMAHYRSACYEAIKCGSITSHFPLYTWRQAWRKTQGHAAQRTESMDAKQTAGFTSEHTTGSKGKENLTVLTLDFCFRHTKPHVWLAVVTGSAELFNSESEKSGYQIKQRGRNDKESKKPYTILSLSSQTLILLKSDQPPQSVTEHLKTLSQLYHNPDTWIQCISISTCTNTTFTLHREMPHFFKPKSQWGMCICDCVRARMYPISWMKSRYWNDTIRCVANQFIFHLPQVVSLQQSPSEFAHTSQPLTSPLIRCVASWVVKRFRRTK